MQDASRMRGEETFDPFDPAHYLHPHERLRSARQGCPVAEFGDGQFYVASDATVRAVLRDPTQFSNVGNFEIEADSSPDSPAIVQLDPPRHSWFRRLLLSAFTPRAVAETEPFVRAMVDELIDGFAMNGSAELITELAGPLPSQVITHLLGVPESDSPKFWAWTREITASVPFHKGLPAWSDFMGYLCDLIADRRAATTHPDDLVARLMTAEIDGARLTDDEIRISIFQLIAAGNDPTTHLIGNCVYELLTLPSGWERVRAERSLVSIAIEESLRHTSPIQFVLRTSKGPAELAAVEIGNAARVVVGIASANRDDESWEAPDTFSLDREHPGDHVAFGHGIHLCLGATLARMQASLAIGGLLDRLPKLRLADGFIYEKVDGPFNHGPKRLNIAWPLR